MHSHLKYTLCAMLNEWIKYKNQKITEIAFLSISYLVCILLLLIEVGKSLVSQNSFHFQSSN